MNRLLIALVVIAAGLLSGYGLQQAVARGRIRLPVGLDVLRKRLQKTALLFLLPLTVAGTIWVAAIPSAAIAALPLICVGAILLGGFLALGASRLLGLDDRKTGAMLPCGGFTNIGAVGALVCYLFLGEQGFALVPIYKLFEEVTYYGVGFPLAKYVGARDGRGAPAGARLKGLARDPFILAALASIAAGGALNASGVPRPAAFSAVNAVCIPLGSWMLLASIGLAMRFRSMHRYLRECAAVAAIKFLLVPAAATAVAYGIGYGRLEGGLPLKVVLVLSAMPVAFTALIPPSLYDLDLDLANACWFFTTAGLAIVLPVLLFLIERL